MPRFDDENNAANRRFENDQRDRSVPNDENYYNGYGDDLNQLLNNDFNIRDNQNQFVNTNDYSNIDLDSFGSQPRQGQEHQVRNPEPPRQNGKKKKKKKKALNKTKRKIIAIIAIILAIILLLNGCVNSVLRKITYDEKVENQYVNSSELMHDKDITNILLLGVDARIIKGEEAENSRSDSMMLISIDKKTNCIKTVSFLRDTWVYIPCKDVYHRLNSACVYGGYSGVVDTIEYNFGVDIDGYVAVNFSVFQKLVDGIGGVEIDVSEKEAKEVTNHKVRYGNVTLEPGKQKLTGKQALAYCRIRKIDSDFVRTKRQRTVIKSIISGIKSNPLKAFPIANGCAEYIETDLTKSQIKKLGFNSLTCIKNDMYEEKVPFEGTWEYATKNGMSVIAVNYEKNKTKLIDFIYNKTPDELKAEQDAEN